jgi:hypothetical protein
MAKRDKVDNVIKESAQTAEIRKQRRALQTAQAQARYRAKCAVEDARMKRIAEKAEQFNTALKQADVAQLTLPLSLVADDVEQTLTNLTDWLTLPEELREQARDKRKRR